MLINIETKIFLLMIMEEGIKQHEQQHHADRKNHSPATAAVLSLMFLGAGQLYNKQYKKFALIWGVSILSIFVVVFLFSSTFNPNKLSLFFPIFLDLILAVLWIGSIIDAYSTAVEIKEGKQVKDEIKFSFKEAKKKFKLGKWDLMALAALAGFIILMAVLIYAPKGGCEVARAGFACVPAKDVLIEDCNYWSKWNCDSTKDASLPDIEFQIGSLCKIQNNLHGQVLDCSSLKNACNQITEKQACPFP